MQTLKKGTWEPVKPPAAVVQGRLQKNNGTIRACDWTVSITHFLRKLLALSHFADGRTVSGR